MDNEELNCATDHTKKTTVMDALYMANEDWTRVTPETIRNCSRKGGFITPDGATTQSDVVVEPPAGMDAEQFERFVEVDHDLDCIGDPTDEDICSDVREARSGIHDNETPE